MHIAVDSVLAMEEGGKGANFCKEKSCSAFLRTAQKKEGEKLIFAKREEIVLNIFLASLLIAHLLWNIDGEALIFAKREVIMLKTFCTLLSTACT